MSFAKNSTGGSCSIEPRLIFDRLYSLRYQFTSKIAIPRGPLSVAFPKSRGREAGHDGDTDDDHDDDDWNRYSKSQVRPEVYQMRTIFQCSSKSFGNNLTFYRFLACSLGFPASLDTQL